jgi:hypothetical protein
VNHLHLMVPSVPEAAAFFERYFELRKTGGNAGLTVLLDDAGFVLTLMKLGSKSTGAYPAKHSAQAFEVIRRAYPALEPCEDALSAALMNAGPIIHPPLILMNAAPLEHFERWVDSRRGPADSALFNEPR